MFDIIKKQTNFLRTFMRFSTRKQEMESKLTNKIIQRLRNSDVDVHDMSQGSSVGVNFNIYVQSQQFVGKSLVQQHQMVKDAIFRQLKYIKTLNIKTKIKHPPAQKTAPPNAPSGNIGQDRRIMDGNQGNPQSDARITTVQGGRGDVTITITGDSGSGNI